MIAQIEAFAFVRDRMCWFEIKIYDWGELPSRNDPGCDPNYEIGRVFVDHDQLDPWREEIENPTDTERLELDAIAGDAVHEHLQESMSHY